jgi:hypothetical protein
MNQPMPHSNSRSSGKTFQSGKSVPSDICAPASSVPAETSRHVLERQIFQALGVSAANPLIEAFVGYIFEDESVLDAYFFAKELGHQPGSARPARLISRAAAAPASLPIKGLLPLEAAQRAGKQAQRMAIIPSEERHLVRVAAFLYPCSLFHLSRIETLSGTVPPIPTFEAIDTMRALLLEQSLHRLRVRHARLGNTLAAALGLPHDDDVNIDQVTRMATAVYLANLEITSLWTEQAGRV